MGETRDRSTGGHRLTSGGRSPTRLVWPLLFGFIAGTGAFAGYFYWSHQRAQLAAETAVEQGLAKPDPRDCAIARAALAAIHAAGDDARWRAALGPLTLKARSQTVNPVDVPGYADDEAENLRGKTAADWRGCAGMGGFVRSLGWSAMSGDEDIAEIGLAQPGVDAAGDEAKVYELVAAPQPGSGALLRARGPWLATLHRDGAGWRVTGRADVSR